MEIEVIKQIVADVMKVDIREIGDDTTFVNDLGADSLDIFRMIMNVEEKFSIILPKDSITRINTVGDVIEIIKTL